MLSALFGVAVMMMTTGCMSPYKVTDEFQNEKKNLHVVTKDTEIRSFLGTNGGGDIYELCQAPEKKVFFYTNSDFTDCKVIQPNHPLYAVLHHKQSRGAGPEVLAGAFIAAGVGASGGATAAASAGASATNIAVQSVTTGKHRR